MCSCLFTGNWLLLYCKIIIKWIFIPKLLNRFKRRVKKGFYHFVFNHRSLLQKYAKGHTTKKSTSHFQKQAWSETLFKQADKSQKNKAIKPGTQIYKMFSLILTSYLKDVRIEYITLLSFTLYFNPSPTN